MGDPLELFQILFTSTDIWGYIGVSILISAALLMTKKEKSLGFIWMIVLGIMAVEYFTLLTVTGYYGLHIVLCIMGELLCLITIALE